MRYQAALRHLSIAAATVAAVGAFGSQPAFAAQDTDTFLVSATVLDACSITANDLGFGNYDPSAGNIDATTTLDVTCTTGTGFELGLNGGTTSGNVAARQMSGPGVALNYSLFRDAARTQNWEDIGSGNTVTGTGDGTSQSVTVYGRLPGSQFTTGGFYSDTVTATVDF